MKVDRQFISGYGMAPGMIYIKEHRPSTPTEGITVHAETRVLRLDDNMIVNVTSELIRVGLGNGDVKFEGGRITILRASVRLGSDGFFELIPEYANDKEGALVFFDIGSGGYSCVEFSTEPFATIASGVTDYVPFIGFDTVLLVAMKPGSSVLARRHSKRWIFFGESVVRETLSYHFDGKTLSLQN
jgi:hypothetical protein